MTPLPALLLALAASAAAQFASVAVGAGGAAGTAAFGVASAAGPLSAAASGARGGLANVATTVVAPPDRPDPSPPAPQPAPLALAPLAPLLARPAYAVPDYRAAVPATKTKVKVRRPAPAPAPAAAPPPEKVCWTIQKRCCHEQVHKGYECRDFYAYRYARCHPVIEYEQICGPVSDTPHHHPKPDSRVAYEETIIKNYDARYGPHVEGYPHHGESDYYRTPLIPQRPHGVTGDPFPAPPSYDTPAEPHNSPADDAHQAPSSAPAAYHPAAPPKPAATGPPPPPQPEPDAKPPAPTPPAYEPEPAPAPAYVPEAPPASPPVTSPAGANDTYAAVEDPVQSGGTYRLAQPVEETWR